MKAKNLNASSVKTRNLIRDTFAELLYEKKNINKITVTELVQRADINRSTFYSHYDDVRHVAEDIKAETLKAFFENKTISNVHDIEPFFDEIYAYIKKNDSFFRLIFISDEVTNFVRHLGNICKGRIYEAVNKDDSIRDKHLLELEVSAFSDGIAMQFIRYYHNDYNRLLVIPHAERKKLLPILIRQIHIVDDVLVWEPALTISRHHAMRHDSDPLFFCQPVCKSVGFNEIHRNSCSRQGKKKLDRFNGSVPCIPVQIEEISAFVVHRPQRNMC